ncbi:uncharacterized protein LOC119450782 isoform X3 [Dermacentor silvarum]|nr:uncharacterized protein LOC119450782 isoform X2 [Dermacentor silvarum]XP_049522187.1 uncharacterized protein LOC119450782 isoform X3 [Dermacentor silvarum]
MQRYAAGFQQHGISMGDRVCVHLNNSIDNVAAMYGCIFAGATLVLAKTSLTEGELHYQITDSDSTHVLTEVQFTEKVKKAAASLHLKGLFTMGEADGFVSAAAFKAMDEGSFQECPVEDPRNTVIAIIYTSGTTGLPKGVEFTHYCFVTNHCISKPGNPCDETDVVLLPAPITHGSGFVWAMMTVLDGAVCILTPPRLTLTEFSDIVKKNKVTAAFFFTSFLHVLCVEMLRTGQQLASIRRLGVGGGILAQATYDAAFKAFGNLECLMNLYGMSESGALVCSPTMRGARGIDLGYPTCMTEIKVVDLVSRQKLGPNQTGEICFRIPSVMRGYYKRPKETAELFEGEGWCRSGDAGYYDEEGRFYFVQRIKEMIKCMDNQVVPAELEGLLLLKHSQDIAEVAVVGLEHPEYGEAPAAVIVVRRKGDKNELLLLAERVKKTITDNLAVHKHLYGGVFFLDSLPKTETSKVNRSALAQLCAAMAPM